jgi:hypothetical protein
MTENEINNPQNFNMFYPFGKYLKYYFIKILKTPNATEPTNIAANVFVKKYYGFPLFLINIPVRISLTSLKKIN